jgi:dienelactone hydrolase
LSARVRNFSPWAYWRMRVDATPAPATITRDALATMLGPLPTLVEPDVEVSARESRDGYRVEEIVYDAEAAMAVPALVLVPDRPTGCAVVAVHGHGHTKDSISAPGASDGADYAHRLASAGIVVLAPDLRGFGERADPTPPDQYHCDVDLVNALVVGTTPLALNLWDLARGLDVLAARPEVDAARLGVCGWSYGGTLALFLAAWDERVAAALVSGYLSSVQSSHRMPFNLCGSQVLAGMAAGLDHAALAALVAPRALVVESARDDFLFPLDAAVAAVASARAVYERCAAGDRLVHHIVDGDHRFDGAQSLPSFVALLSTS